MAQIERQQMVLHILQNLRDLTGLKKLFWEELNYERENKPLSMRGWPDSTRTALVDDPILFASGGTDNAFHVVYCRLASDSLQRGLERPIVNQLIREHPYCLLVFSDSSQSAWHFLNIKYDEKTEKRRLLRRITVQAGTGLRTAAERLQLIDLTLMSVPATSRRRAQNLVLLPAKPAGSKGEPPSPLEIQQRHDDAFDVESVTKAFYKELANWYFWALKHVHFPKDAPKEADGHDHIGVIRMITRLIFCWFVKEKGLIPEVLFDQRRLGELLEGFAADEEGNKDSVFYMAILQNLFFATLSTEMDKRGWARDEQNFMAHSLYRYRDLFKKPGEALTLFKNIPFLNGGLFECLDKDLGENVRPRYVRIDGFSRRPDSQPIVPDFLFFGPEREEDLSADYGDKKFRKVRVRGLIHTLQQYRFTIEENTPIEQEVALDPELSGKVFENLLAAYNPETGATARKQTGSFYTPREIVDYMVDEALVAFLAAAVEGSDASRRPRVAGSEISTPVTQGHREPGPGGNRDRPSQRPHTARLRRLISWEESGHDFDARETEALIAAIDGLKALDPAVGSGAFPMGILHKLVFILGKLDPCNEQWEQRQILRVRDAIATAEKIEDAAIRERTVKELEQQIIGIEESFTRNELDYGRKLYLIENCLYGVDIQSIAVQIAKMRFFISLIVDQRVDSSAPNLGVRPLPNLETKFVAANTLIGIEKPKQMLLRNPQIDAKEAQLRRVRERHFTARTLSSKAKCREQDKKLRSEIAELLKSDGWGDKTAKQLSQWDPYDQNASAPFFDPEWMFGVREGFDVVIGNPPYVRIQTLNQTDKSHATWIRNHYTSAAKGNYDLYVVFVERGLQLLESEGQLAYILPHKFFNAQYGKPLRELVAEGKHLRHIVHFGDQQIFPGATNYVCLLFLAKGGTNTCRWVSADDLPVWLQTLRGTEALLPAQSVTAAEWNFVVGKGSSLFERLKAMPVKLEDVAERMFQGSITSADTVFLFKEFKPPKAGLVEVHSKEIDESVALERKLLKRVVRSGDIGRWKAEATALVLFPYEVKNNEARLYTPAEMQKLFPRAWDYLKRSKRRLEGREQGSFKDSQWYRFGRSQNLGLWEQPKLMVPYMITELGAYLDLSDNFYFINVTTGGYGITALPERISLHYLCALLNSPVVDFFLKRVSTTFHGGYFAANKQFIEKIPIPRLNLSDAVEQAKHDAIVGLVTRILATKAAGPSADTTALERKIDGIMYELYGLTEEEIGIVEGAAGKEKK
jgi:adenine-specific DNA-methyltransferase